MREYSRTMKNLWCILSRNTLPGQGWLYTPTRPSVMKHQYFCHPLLSRLNCPAHKLHENGVSLHQFLLIFLQINLTNIYWAPDLNETQQIGIYCCQMTWACIDMWVERPSYIWSPTIRQLFHRKWLLSGVCMSIPQHHCKHTLAANGMLHSLIH